MFAGLQRMFPALLCCVFFAFSAQAEVTVTDGKSLKKQQKRQARSEARLKAGGGTHGPRPNATGSQGLIDSGGLKYFINTNITFSTSSSASAAASEASYTHAVAADTLNGGTTSSTLNDNFDGFGSLCLSLNNTVAFCATGNANFVIYNKLGPPTYDATCSNRQIVFPVQTAGNIQMQRKVFVPSNDQFLRWLNTFTNTSGSPQIVTMSTGNNLGSDSNTKITATSTGASSPLGNTNLDITWVASFQNWSGTTSSDVRTGVVLQQTGAPVQLAGLSYVDGNDHPTWGYTFTIPAGASVTIANFVTGQPTRALAASKAAVLAGGSNANQWNCMTNQEKINVKNFIATTPPTITKAFGAPSIPLQGSTSLTFSITNPNAVALTGLSFSDTLVSGLVVATPNGLVNTCGGTVSAVAGSGTASLATGTLPASGSCALTVNVTGTTVGPKPNTTGVISTTESGPGATSNTVSLSVAQPVPPTIAKAFGAPTIPLQGSTSLTFTIANSNPSGLTGLAFSDTLPAGLVVSTPNGLASTCGGTTTATAGSSSVTLATGTIAANGSCSVSVNVTGTTSGAKPNTSGAISSTESGAGVASNTATVTVLQPVPPTIAVAFGATSIPLQSSTSLTVTITNPNVSTLSSAAFSDTLPAGLVVATPNALTNTCGGTLTAVAGSGSLSLSAGTVAPSGSCVVTVNVTGTTPGSKSNATGTVTATPSGPGTISNTATLLVVAPPTIAKAFGAATIPLQGSTGLTITITNPNASALTGVAFTDNLPAGLVVSTPSGIANTCGGAASAVAGSASVSLSAGTLAASATCTVTLNVTATTPGILANTTGPVSSTEGGPGTTSNTANLGVVQSTFSGPTATGTGTGTASVTVSGGGANCGFTFASFVPVSAVPVSAPGQVTFPQGLFDFTVANCTPGFSMTLVITYPQPIPQFAQYYKYGPTAANTSAHWYVMPSSIVGNTATLTITDGGLGDDDLTANGSITDQGGPGVPPAPLLVPTLQDWHIAMLALLFLLTGILVIRRRRSR